MPSGAGVQPARDDEAGVWRSIPGGRRRGNTRNVEIETFHGGKHGQENRGLATTEKDWDSTVKHLVATLDKFSVPAKEKDEVLTAISSLKKDIVEKS